MVYDHVQCWALGTVQNGGTVPLYQTDFGGQLFGSFNHYHSAVCGQVAINRTGLTTKNAINRNAQSCRFPVHGAATADYSIGEPDQVQAVDRARWNDHPALLK